MDDSSDSKIIVPSRTKAEMRLIEAAAVISERQADSSAYLHGTFAQVALPRRRVEGDEFRRSFYSAEVHLMAGVAAEDGHLVKQPLPYGIRPRQLLVYCTTYALMNRTCEIPLGSSMVELMRDKLGIRNISGGSTGNATMLRQQLYSLLASTITTYWRDKKVLQRTVLFDRIEDPTGWQRGPTMALFPAVASLNSSYLKTVIEHAFPVDPRAVGALESALSMDIYFWLAYTLHKLPRSRVLKWKDLRQQFGQDYSDFKNFKTKFEIAMKEALLVYPGAKVDSVYGGIEIKPSPSAVPKTQVVVPIRSALEKNIITNVTDL